ncbi:hypothetical protein ACFFQF_03635 [Haladaptatus pallidirubidus]|uniref:Uncharacterized protein n=1 Tax=Haladaptatus pallidirubidus TaxID=1008152 RepID=A0AAV3UKN8_9EURY|nr:hypothetical protein [Haladaptatus pallidirubidus]
MSLHHHPLEQIVLKTVTYTLTPFVVAFVGLALLAKGRPRDAYSWFTSEWREPL